MKPEAVVHRGALKQAVVLHLASTLPSKMGEAETTGVDLTTFSADQKGRKVPL